MTANERIASEALYGSRARPMYGADLLWLGLTAEPPQLTAAFLELIGDDG